MHPIIAGEVRRAEALLEGYLAFPPESIELEHINLDRLRRLPQRIKAPLSHLQILVQKRDLTQRDLAIAVNLVDELSNQVSKADVHPRLEILRDIDSALSRNKLSHFMRFVVPMILAAMGIVYCHVGNVEFRDVFFIGGLTILMLILFNSYLSGRPYGTVLVGAFSLLTIGGTLLTFLYEVPAKMAGVYFLISAIIFVIEIIKGVAKHPKKYGDVSEPRYVPTSHELFEFKDDNDHGQVLRHLKGDF